MMAEYITENIEISSDDYDEENYDKENSNKENLTEEIQVQNTFRFYILDVSNDSSLYVTKKSIIFEVTQVVLSDFMTFYVNLTKCITHTTYISHITYITHMIK